MSVPERVNDCGGGQYAAQKQGDTVKKEKCDGERNGKYSNRKQHAKNEDGNKCGNLTQLDDHSGLGNGQRTPFLTNAQINAYQIKYGGDQTKHQKGGDHDPYVAEKQLFHNERKNGSFGGK